MQPQRDVSVWSEPSQTGEEACHLPKRKVETQSLFVPPLHKSTYQTVVNQAVVGILKPTKTGALHFGFPPPCSHDGGGIVIMHRLYLLSVVDAFYIAMPLQIIKNNTLTSIYTHGFTNRAVQQFIKITLINISFTNINSIFTKISNILK